MEKLGSHLSGRYEAGFRTDQTLSSRTRRALAAWPHVRRRRPKPVRSRRRHSRAKVGGASRSRVARRGRLVLVEEGRGEATHGLPSFRTSESAASLGTSTPGIESYHSRPRAARLLGASTQSRHIAQPIRRARLEGRVEVAKGTAVRAISWSAVIDLEVTMSTGMPRSSSRASAPSIRSTGRRRRRDRRGGRDRSPARQFPRPADRRRAAPTSDARPAQRAPVRACATPARARGRSALRRSIISPVTACDARSHGRRFRFTPLPLRATRPGCSPRLVALRAPHSSRHDIA